jgi:putative glutamine amidotransferase
MKQIYLVVFLAISLFGCKLKSSKEEVNVYELDNSKPSIILMHPTVKNLKTFIYLIDNGIFPLSEDYQIVGLYHKLGNYSYNQTADFIKNEGLNRFKLVEVEPELSPKELFMTNSCSPTLKTIFQQSKGAIFFGGPDLPPNTYDKKVNLLTEITDVHRHYLELTFLFQLLGGWQDTLFTPLMAENKSFTLLGICLGMQSMNVATGGTMVQDIPTEIYGLKTIEDVLSMEIDQQHRNYHTNFGTDTDLIWGSFHRVKLESGSLLDSLNEFSPISPTVWSSHHQCVDRLGKGMAPIAWSIDGKIVEAMVHSKYPNVIGVQFHPEVPAIYNSQEMLKQLPLQPASNSYINIFPGNKGENFHKSFWRYIGTRF